ncbi:MULTISPECIES: PadR family transcriptional regulator [unclassified Pseudactinotalea]|uniref:PadR family transcriptional regulator n=1 Tax=unclassified Pseudactinotalea TaxID=2649176 RepID=UPI001D1388CF|nr:MULTISPECIES: PadR family transcriptional regulator [unclassified Pseudactinotalea]
MLELAILGQLRDEPMHGYALRKQLNISLGALRTLSYGSLYPTLKSLLARGLIEGADSHELPHALAGRRARIVYQLTAEGKDHLDATLHHVDAAASEDAHFDVRFSLFAEVDPSTRLRILEGRRARILARREALREHVATTRERRDAYTQEMHRYGLEKLDREVRWLEDLITAEQRGPAHPHEPNPSTPPGDPSAESTKES